MGIISSIMTGCFVIVCLLVIILVLLQSDKSGGAGFLGGSSQSTFGSSTADVVTKITGVLVALFLLIALALAGISSFSKSSVRDELLKTTESPVEAPAEAPAGE